MIEVKDAIGLDDGRGEAVADFEFPDVGGGIGE
jgi:hypothetical protein